MTTIVSDCCTSPVGRIKERSDAAPATKCNSMPELRFARSGLLQLLADAIEFLQRSERGEVVDLQLADLVENRMLGRFK